mgnify:CR=1 FL=1
MYHRFNENKYPSTNIRMDIFKKCLVFLDTRVALDQSGFKFDIFEH